MWEGPQRPQQRDKPIVATCAPLVGCSVMILKTHTHNTHTHTTSTTHGCGPNCYFADRRHGSGAASALCAGRSSSPIGRERAVIRFFTGAARGRGRRGDVWYGRLVTRCPRVNVQQIRGVFIDGRTFFFKLHTLQPARGAYVAAMGQITLLRPLRTYPLTVRTYSVRGHCSFWEIHSEPSLLTVAIHCMYVCI